MAPCGAQYVEPSPVAVVSLVGMRAGVEQARLVTMEIAGKYETIHVGSILVIGSVLLMLRYGDDDDALAPGIRALDGFSPSLAL